MRKPLKQSGFAFLELILVIVIVGALVVIGLWVYNRHQPNSATTANTTTSSGTQSPVARNVSSAPQINSTSDLDTALTTLNQNDPAASNSGDQSQLNSQTNF